MYLTVIEPRVSETDGVGHINNTTIPIWLEAGRNKLFKLFNPDDTFHDWKMIILKTNVEYVAQIYFGKDVEVKTWVKKNRQFQFRAIRGNSSRGQTMRYWYCSICEF